VGRAWPPHLTGVLRSAAAPAAAAAADVARWEGLALLLSLKTQQVLLLLLLQQ
jgi:hypothetical protein